MAQFVGDLAPRGSGTASLGVDQIGFGGFNLAELFPFAHVHANSGILHDPMMGTSGVFRFREGREYDKLQFHGNYSDAGADLFGYIPVVTGNDPLAGGDFNVHVPAAANILTGTELRLEAPELFINGDNILRISGSGAFGVILEAPNGQVNINAESIAAFSSNNNTRVRSDQQTIISSFGTSTTNGSGNLRYEFGPNEAWHTFVGAGNTDLVPIPHSGHVLQMILENVPDPVSLEQAYTNGPTISVTGDDVAITTDDATFALGTYSGDNPPLVVSGITTVPQDDRRYGITMMTHGEMFRNGGLGTNDDPSVLSLGIDTPVVTTGSGIIPLAHCSGIQKFSNGAASQSITAVLPSFDTVIFSAGDRFGPDKYCTWDSSATGVRVFAPGIYRVAGCVTSFMSGAGIEHSICVFVNGTRQNGSFSARVNNGATMGIGFYYLVNLDANDLVSIGIGKRSAVGSASVFARESNIFLEYVGPRRYEL